jgi:ribosomal protein S27E
MLDMEEEESIDRNLVALWSQWKQYVSLCLSDEDMADVDWIENFCTDMRYCLMRLTEEGKLSVDARSVALSVASSQDETPQHVFRARVVPEELRPSPRRLPTVCLDRTECIVDERLREFRQVHNPHARVLFASWDGRRMLKSFYVDVCPSCRQEVAVRVDTAGSHVICPVCGTAVAVDRSLCKGG